ncbi:NEP1-interacting protein 2-like [Carica papaya]|uniref:NEP1-interacting protein 2-like n=1 Tax=Carica papaya TaxID=3649 RepID=UPI000B8CE095|nr:NEP1-interacting protein 2-like [Carica papaya]
MDSKIIATETSLLQLYSSLSSFCNILIHSLGSILYFIILLSIYTLGVLFAGCFITYLIEIILWFLVRRPVRSAKDLISLMSLDWDTCFALGILAVDAGTSIVDALEKLLVRESSVLEIPSSSLTSQAKLIMDAKQIRFHVGETASSDTACAICLDEFMDGNLCRVIPVCNHIFHSTCVDQWLKNCPSCPLCRRVMGS